MARTLPPTRNTTSTTEVAYPGVPPIDAYSDNMKRPLAFFESDCSVALTTATASIPTLYVHAILTAGMSGNISATAAHFQTHLSGTAVGKVSGVASWVQLDASSSGYQGTVNDVATVITPLNVGVRATSGTITMTNNTIIYGIHAQYIVAGATISPSKIFFGRVNTGATAPTALFYAESRTSAAYSEATKSTAAGSFPLIVINDAVANAALYVNLYEA